ncbi:MAG: methylenetetrahydrofolate reductase [Firmicutes bacterium]|nr:methylenetetrahydrofolate reductase [Bacillota bacterium]
MKISEIINSGKISISFEVFPPKAWQSLEETRNVVSKMTELSPSFMSVTCRSGSSIDYTAAVASAVEAGGVPSLAHLTCYSSDMRGVDETMRLLSSEGIDNILALRGDPPTDGSEIRTDFAHASDLTAYIKSHGDFCVGGACYPDAHPESTSYDMDIEYLKMKEDAGADFLTTQMFFDNNIYYAFRYRMLKAGIKIPVIAGIMPITKKSQVFRSAQLSGSPMPRRVLSMADKFGDNPAAMRQAGIAYAEEQIVDLLSNGVNHIHIYTMNSPETVGAIMSGLSEIIKERA